MAWTQTDLDKLKKAIASGAKRVQYNDFEVEYRTQKEMLEALKMISDSLGVTSAAPNHTTYVTGKGL